MAGFTPYFYSKRVTCKVKSTKVDVNEIRCWKVNTFKDAAYVFKWTFPIFMKLCC